MEKTITVAIPEYGAQNGAYPSYDGNRFVTLP